MMHKLALKNLLRSPVMHGMMVLQLSVIYIVAISMTSSLLSRFSYYMPLRKILKSDGEYYVMSQASDPDTGNFGTTTEALTAKLQGNPSVSVSYQVWIAYMEQKPQCYIAYISMDNQWLETYTPELAGGNWFSVQDWNKTTIPIVVSQNEYGFDVGDMIEFLSFGTEQPVTCEVIGVLQEGARILGYSIAGENAFSCKYMYQNFYHTIEETTLVIMPQSLLNTDVINTVPNGPLLITYPDGTDDAILESNHNYLNRMRHLYSFQTNELYHNSIAYIFDECKALFPILLAVLSLTLVSTMSVNAISVKRQLHNYAIYYICGLRWRSCVHINFLSSLYLSLISLLLTFAGLFLVQYLGWLEEYVVQIGWVQLLSCLLIVLVYVGFSIIFPLQMIWGSTPKTVLRSN